MTDKMKSKTILLAIAMLFTFQLIHTLAVQGASEQPGMKFRVIAHSDESIDQITKHIVVSALQATDLTTVTPEHLEHLTHLVSTILDNIGATHSFELSLGYHYFPDQSAYHYSLLVRLGDARGENWWCFVNPGVCTRPLDTVVHMNEHQTITAEATREELQTGLGRIWSNLFGTQEVNASEVANGYFDWHLFDDER